VYPFQKAKQGKSKLFFLDKESFYEEFGIYPKRFCFLIETFFLD
jgi:hypothetical protein